jgi:hypothetical protein
MNLPSIKADTDEMILVGAFRDGAVPQSTASDLIGIAMTFYNQQVVDNEQSPSDFCVSCTKRFDFTEVERVSIDVGDSQIRHLSRKMRPRGAELESPLRIAYLTKPRCGPAFRIRRRIAEEVEEEGLDEDIELSKSVAALALQGLGLTQDRRNPLLLRQRWEGDFQALDNFPRDPFDRGTARQSLEVYLLRAKKLHQIGSIKLLWVRCKRRNILAEAKLSSGDTNFPDTCSGYQ